MERHADAHREDIRLYPLNSSKMKIVVDDAGLLSGKNKIWYVYTDGTGKQHKINPDDILHFKGLTTNGIVGISPIETLKSTIENGKAAGNFFEQRI